MRCSAYCSASAYHLHILFHLLKANYPSVLSREYVLISSEELDESDKAAVFFPFGVCVFWGWEEAEELQVIRAITSAAVDPLLNPEFDSYDFHYGEKLQIRRDRLVLTNSNLNTKLAISFGLAQSIKLTVFEETIYKTVENSKSLPQELASKGKISLSRKTIAKKIGELFLDKASVNLHSDILDEPDFFWEHPETQPFYIDVLTCLDVNARVNVLNHRLAILGDVLEILNDQLNHQHSSALEWTVIWLIALEVLVTLLKDVLNII